MKEWKVMVKKMKFAWGLSPGKVNEMMGLRLAVGGVRINRGNF